MLPLTLKKVLTELPDREALRRWFETGDDQPAARELLVLSGLYASQAEVSCRRIMTLTPAGIEETLEFVANTAQ